MKKSILILVIILAVASLVVDGFIVFKTKPPASASSNQPESLADVSTASKPIIVSTSAPAVVVSNSKTTPATKTVSKPVVKAKTAVKAPVKKTTTAAKTSLVWDASAKRIINNYAGFDYSSAIRNAYIKKVETYARQHGIKVITASMMQGL